MKVSELTSENGLNKWAAKAQGWEIYTQGVDYWQEAGDDFFICDVASYRPSTDWAQGGELVAKHWDKIKQALEDWFGGDIEYGCYWPDEISTDILAWFMRALVFSVFGEEVEE